jgi:hypothetical protein
MRNGPTTLTMGRWLFRLTAGQAAARGGKGMMKTICGLAIGLLVTTAAPAAERDRDPPRGMAQIDGPGVAMTVRT